MYHPDFADLICVNPGSGIKTGRLETRPAAGSDDQIVGGQVRGGADGILQTARSGDDLPLGITAIGSGPDNILNSRPPAGSDDVIENGFIAPGRDGICQTTAASADAQVLAVGSSIVSPYGFNDLNPIASIDEWLYIQDLSRIAVPGAFGSNAEGTPMREATTSERAADQRFSALADLSVSVSTSSSHSAGRRLTLQYEIHNDGPGVAQLATLFLSLPSGLSFAGCSTSSGSCAAQDQTIAAYFDALSAGATAMVVVEIAVGCELAADDTVAVVAKVFSRTFDKQRGNDAATAVVRLAAFLGMEDPERPWVVSYSNGAVLVPRSTAQSSEGDYSLALTCGYQAFETPTFHTLELGKIGDSVRADVLAPSSSGWVGDLQMFVDLPAAGVWNQWVGSVDLAGVPRGTWSPVSFPLSANLKEALLGAFPHARGVSG